MSDHLYPSRGIKAITDLCYIGDEYLSLTEADLVLVCGSDLLDTTIKEMCRMHTGGIITQNTVIILSGNKGSKNADFETTEAEYLFEKLINAGFSAEKIVLEPNATRGDHNFAFSAEIIKDRFGGFDRFNNILVLCKDFATGRFAGYARKFGYPMDKIHFFGIEKEDGTGTKYNWWQTSYDYERVFAEVVRIGEYGKKKDLIYT